MMRNIFKKKLAFLTLLILLCFLTNSCYSNPQKKEASDIKQVILRIAETHSTMYPSTQGVNEFAKLVEKRSDGRIKIVVYDSGRLGNEASVIEQVQFGGIDFARIDMSSLEAYSSNIKLFMLPYDIKSSQQMWELMDSSIGTSIKRNLFKERFVSLCSYEAGARCFYNSKRAINSISDLKSLKIRIQQSQQIMNSMLLLGVSPIFVEPGDVYKSLQEGLIDGAEDNIITYYQSKNYEVARFLTLDNHFRIPEMIIASRVSMMQLSMDDQNLIEQAAKDSAILQKIVWYKKEKEVMNFIVKSGINITKIDDIDHILDNKK